MKTLPYFQHKLSNGLQILAEANPDAHSFAAGIFVRTGSRDEPNDINGVSHFLEHMMFKGSSRLNSEEMNRIFDEMGARYNAFTSQEMTAYYANVLPEFTQATLEHLRELFEPALRVADFETEKKVILEEIAMYEDEPGHRVYERLMAEHFSGHPLGMSILGPADSIRDMQQPRMSEYFQQHYGAGNMCLSVTGRFDFDEIVKLAEKTFGHWNSAAKPRQYSEPSPTGQTIEMADSKLNRDYLMAMMPGPSAQDPRRHAARLLGDILGDSEGSRLYWALVDNAIADEADFGFYPHDQSGSFYLSLTTDPSRSEQAFEIAMKELHRVRDDLKEDEVTRARNKCVTSVVLSGEVPIGRMRSIGSQWVYNGKYRSLEEDLAELQRTDRQAVLELLRSYNFSPLTAVRLGPGKTE